MPGISTCANTPLWPQIRCKRGGLGGSTRSIGCHALPSDFFLCSIFSSIDTRKPEKRVLEVEGHARDLHMCQHTSLASDSV